MVCWSEHISCNLKSPPGTWFHITPYHHERYASCKWLGCERYSENVGSSLSLSYRLTPGTQDWPLTRACTLPGSWALAAPSILPVYTSATSTRVWAPCFTHVFVSAQHSAWRPEDSSKESVNLQIGVCWYKNSPWTGLGEELKWPFASGWLCGLGP